MHCLKASKLSTVPLTKPLNQSMGDIINNLVEDIKKYEIDLLFHFPLLLTDFKK